MKISFYSLAAGTFAVVFTLAMTPGCAITNRHDDVVRRDPCTGQVVYANHSRAWSIFGANPLATPPTTVIVGQEGCWQAPVVQYAPVCSGPEFYYPQPVCRPRVFVRPEPQCYPPRIISGCSPLPPVGFHTPAGPVFNPPRGWNGGGGGGIHRLGR